MARGSKGAASVALSELDIVRAPTGTEEGPQSSPPEEPSLTPPRDPEPPSAESTSQGGGEESHVDANLEELDAVLGGSAENGGEDPAATGGGEEPQGPTPNRALASVPTRTTRRPRRKASDTKLRVELNLPEEVMNRGRASVRTQFTGLERSKGMNFVFEAYVLAVDDLVGGAGAFDLHGIETVEDMAERVKAALAATLALAPESAAA